MIVRKERVRRDREETREHEKEEKRGMRNEVKMKEGR
jgi:hypothetical protein